jgi:DNA-binding CsgD family transcriptional regulator
MLEPMTTTNTTRRSADLRRSPILERLTTEWRHLAVRAADLDHVRQWGLPGAEVHSLDDVLIRCGYRPAPVAGTPRAVRSAADRSRREAAEQAQDDYLLRVLTIARHDRLAGRIALQRILPSLCALARRRSSTVPAQQDLLDDLVANAWPSIRTYPLDRRPRWIVPNLVRDVEFQTFVRPLRRHNAAELPMAIHDLRDGEHMAHAEPLDELVDLLNEARRGGLSQTDVDLICQIVTHNRTDLIADQLQVSSRTVRNHRDAIVHRLRTVALAA